MGFSCSEIRIIGGPTKSDLWNQIQADVYGIPVESLRVKDAAVLGGAMAAAVGAGMYGGFREAAERMARVDRRFEPRRENRAVYEELYQIYLEAYRALEASSVYRRITDLQAAV